ncbi:ribonuclease H-like domain-containing protein [Paraphoma chrysanthemicola]|uniref:Ribonuclease H-like domain-containing protein n=1 Tax=Paraphoma chrysanthemicola TaxID=798071 RepID=A0A8K0QYN3_9PLEO|nr:ribonuclease H-like domain-containing protein [Paraphoma chrysanthemicola]
MEVDAASFPHHLLGLFIHISEADFVSFDLELSGIPSRLPEKKPRPGGGRFSLEERYAETKEGADRYQILQVGITCARFDYIANHYVLRPYNINISPLLDERLDIEREISMQSGALTFLLGCGFDLAKPFTHGVQYLSREEAEFAKQATWDRLDKKNPPEDMQLKEGDVDSLDFMRRVREAITKWKASTSESLSITTHTGLKEQPLVQAISRFEKRLVHQLVRAEFPELVSIGRSECIRIVNFDPVREAENTRRIKNRVKEQIARQTGFRWIFEALTSGNVDGADPLYVNRNGGGMGGHSYDVRDRYDRAVERLKTRQPVLVGHNMFTDIVYLYRTFVGQLPNTLQEFNDAIHDLFPKIVDTKYLATHAEGDLNASPTLQEIAESLSNQPLPSIVTHSDHSKYQEIEAFHEAGYDSLLTATIMIRLAAKLGMQRSKKDTPAPSNSGSDKGGIAINTPEQIPEDFIRDGREKVTKPVPLPPVENHDTSSKKKKKSKSRKKKAKSEETQARRFQTKNIFDNLRDLDLNPDSDATEEDQEHNHAEDEHVMTFDAAEASTTTWQPQPDAAPGSWADEVYVQDKTGWVPIEQSERHAMEMIPGFDKDSAFWKEFGNTLRVFGTKEAVLKIAEW